MKNLIIKITILIAVVVSITFSVANNPEAFITRDTAPRKVYSSLDYHYAGAYQVEVEGVYSPYEVEAYILAMDGTAKYMHIIPDSKGAAKIDFQLYGTYTEEGSMVTISVNGKTGTITETFNMNSKAGRHLVKQ